VKINDEAGASRIEVVDESGRSGDKFFSSPDVGRLVRRDDLLYTQYGTVLSSDAFVRMMPVDNDAHENYADWTEEHRREVREAFERQCHLEEIEKAVRRAYRGALVEQARAKWATEEFEAVYDQGFAHGRGPR
jgi:hypothetical protein